MWMLLLTYTNSFTSCLNLTLYRSLIHFQIVYTPFSINDEVKLAFKRVKRLRKQGCLTALNGTLVLIIYVRKAFLTNLYIVIKISICADFLLLFTIKLSNCYLTSIVSLLIFFYSSGLTLSLNKRYLTCRCSFAEVVTLALYIDW